MLDKITVTKGIIFINLLFAFTLGFGCGAIAVILGG